MTEQAARGQAGASGRLVRLRGYRELLRPYATGDVYLNFVGDEGHERVRAGFGASHARLAQIKAEWDPDNLFHGNQNLRPAEKTLSLTQRRDTLAVTQAHA